jgi:hypothetical protein
MRRKITFPARPMSTLGAMGILFLYLHFTGHVDWPFWLVILPFWIIPALTIAFFVVGIPVVFIKGELAERRNKRAARARFEKLYNYTKGTK